MKREVVSRGWTQQRTHNPPNCLCFCNLNFYYLKTPSGFLKLLQLILCSLCECVLLKFGLKYASLIGFSYDVFLSTVSAALFTTTIITIIYTFSANSMALIRSSYFELIFNGWSSLNYFSSCSWMMFVLQMFLYPEFLSIPFYFIYPIMFIVNVLGFLLGLLYGIDAYLAYKYLHPG